MQSELITALKEYIVLLENALDKQSGFLFAHGIYSAKEDIDKGEELRAKIKELDVC